MPGQSYSISGTQNYFEFTIKKHEIFANNPPVKIYINNIENRATFKIKTGCYLELLMPETMNLLGSTENKVTKDKHSETVPHLAHCNIVDNDYQQNASVLHTFVSINHMVLY